MLSASVITTFYHPTPPMLINTNLTTNWKLTILFIKVNNIKNLRFVTIQFHVLLSLWHALLITSDIVNYKNKNSSNNNWSDDVKWTKKHASWWCHEMETSKLYFTGSLWGNPPVTKRTSHVELLFLFDVNQNKLLWNCHWFEMLWCPCDWHPLKIWQMTIFLSKFSWFFFFSIVHMTIRSGGEPTKIVANVITFEM